MATHEELKAAARDALTNMAQAVGFSLFNVADDKDALLLPWAFAEQDKPAEDVPQ